MGTAHVVFEEVERGGATGSHVTGSDVSHVTGSDPVRKYVLRMPNVSCAISALVGPFDRK